VRRGLPLPAAIVLASCGAGAVPPSLAHPLAGAAAPEFQRESTDAREVGVPGSDRTKATIVDFWASWCGACQETMPALDKLWRDRREEGLMVIGVSVDEVPDEAVAMAEHLGASFPVVLDPHQRLAATYGVAKVPLTFVVDRVGTVRWVGRDPSAARRAVDVLLAEGTPPPSAAGLRAPRAAGLRGPRAARSE